MQHFFLARKAYFHFVHRQAIVKSTDVINKSITNQSKTVLASMIGNNYIIITDGDISEKLSSNQLEMLSFPFNY